MRDLKFPHYELMFHTTKEGTFVVRYFPGADELTEKNINDIMFEMIKEIWEAKPSVYMLRVNHDKSIVSIDTEDVVVIYGFVKDDIDDET